MDVPWWFPVIHEKKVITKLMEILTATVAAGERFICNAIDGAEDIEAA